MRVWWWLRRFAVVTFLAVAAWLLWVVMVPVALPSVPYNLTVEANRTLSQVARQLATQKIIRHRLVMIALARLASTDRKLKAGIYCFYHPVSMLEILERFADGQPDQASVMLVEGWTFRQFRQALAKNPDLQQTTAHWSAAQILREIGATDTDAEGLLFPNTYFFPPESADLLIFFFFFAAMQQQLDAIWAQRAAHLPYRSPYEMLIMASLIEKETSRDEDRPLVAAVLVNRLKAGIRLQTDPTVIYGMGEAFDGNLRKIDLQRDTPFNTYTRSGLPPTPIAMPGKASLDAAAHPAHSKALYFVATRGGESHFSETLQEHNSVVKKYILKKGQ